MARMLTYAAAVVAGLAVMVSPLMIARRGMIPGLAAVAAAEEAPLRVGGNVTRPDKISGPPPVYTELARKARIQGTVIIEAVIDAEGNAVNLRVLKRLPMGLDQAAVDAVKKWKFKPSTLDGKPVRVFYTLTVNFNLP